MAKRRRTARQSANVQEYRRLRRNLMARMRYREKQGFKVDYTTAPKTMEFPTSRDIERLTKTQVKINRYGEVVATRKGKATKQYRDINRQDVITQKEILKEYGQEQEQQSKQVTEPVSIDMDYTGMVYGALVNLKERAEAYLDEWQPEYSNHWQAEEWYTAWMGVYETLLDLLDEEYARVGENTLNEYYKLRFSEISKTISDYLQEPMSKPEDVVNSSSFSQLMFLLKCPLKGE